MSAPRRASGRPRAGPRSPSFPDEVRHVWAAWYALIITVALASGGSLELREASSDERILLLVGSFLLVFCCWELLFWATGGRVLRWFGDDKD